MFGKDIVGRLHVARNDLSCVACNLIKKGGIYMRFEAFVMQKHCIHVECYADDNPNERFFVATNNKPVWSSNIVMVDPSRMEECLIEIQNCRPKGKLRDSNGN